MTTVTYLRQGVLVSGLLLGSLILRKIDKIRGHIDTHLLLIWEKSPPMVVEVLGAAATLLHPCLATQPSVQMYLLVLIVSK